MALGRTNLVTWLNWMVSPPLRAAFKRVRKEGYKVRYNLTGTAGAIWLMNNTRSPKDKYLYFKKVKALRTIDFYYQGDFELIEGILASEGLLIGRRQFPVFGARGWFNLSHPNHPSLHGHQLVKTVTV
jgi:hypothetical protein